MSAQLQALAAQSIEMTVALEAAQARIAADTEHASVLAKELKDAKKKLAKLEASIAKAKRQSAQHNVVVTKTKTVTTSKPKSHEDDEDEHEDEDDEHEGGDD